MSYKKTFVFDGSKIKIPADFVEFEEDEISTRIKELQSLSEEVMTVKEMKELETLLSKNCSKINKYGFNITSKNGSINYNGKFLSIAAFDGDKINLYLKDGFFIFPLSRDSSKYFDSNFDEHLDVFLEICSKLKIDIKVYEAYNEESDEDDFDDSELCHYEVRNGEIINLETKDLSSDEIDTYIGY